MSHAVLIPDELYRAIEAYAARRGESIEAAILAWAESPREQRAPVEDNDANAYNPADDPLAAFLGRGELTSPDAIRRHEALDAHDE